jgi:type VI protein secretion system component Hcp
MKTESTIAVFSKYLAALAGFALIFGIATHASAAPIYKYYLVISSTTPQIPVTSFKYTGVSGTGNSENASIEVIHPIDTYSPTFLADQFTGTSLGTVTLICELFNAESIPIVTLEYKMSDCQIVSDVQGGAGDNPQEEITFGFSAISLKYTPRSTGGFADF